MTTLSFVPIPENLTANQRAHWMRRQQTARNTLAIQAQAGNAANAETTACFQRYVRGEASLSHAMDEARRQTAQEHNSFRRLFQRRASAAGTSADALG
ncbi:hypothetical protein [Hymenobacter rubidus]|uniref:hypothetical protein n=1 Tax=Hymenobacter rubidus TaxID=1441626 RepID=UPI00191FCCCE|nr:hypothetical protein [Hymenobacter rubidus]